MTHAWNPSTQVVEAKEFLGVKTQSGLPSEILCQNSKHTCPPPLPADVCCEMHSRWMDGPCCAAKVLCSFAIVYWISYHIKSKACYCHFEAIKERIHMNIIFYFRNSITETFFLESMMSLWHVLSRLSQVCGVLHVLSLDSEAACDRGCLEDSLSYLEAEAEESLSARAQGCPASTVIISWNGMDLWKLIEIQKYSLKGHSPKCLSWNFISVDLLLNLLLLKS